MLALIMLPKYIPKYISHLRNPEMANTQEADADPTACELTVKSLEATQQKFFDEAVKHAKPCFERLEDQLDSFQLTLEKKSNEFNSQCKIIFTQQMNRVEDSATKHSMSLKKL